MEDDAIQTDVSAEEAAPVLSERDLAMQEIQQQLADRYAEPEPEVEPPVTVEATPEVTKVRVKVDGVEQEMSLEDVIKGYQKDSVASKRLEQAAAQQKENDRRAQELAERERQIAAAQIPSVTDESSDDEIQSAINALVDGDNESAAKFLRDAVNKGRQAATPAPDPEAIASRVKEDLRADRAREEQAKAFKEFAATNPMFDEPAEGETKTPQRVLGDHTFDTVYGPMFERGEISYREALDKTAEHVAKIFAPPAAPVVNEREQRKQKIDNIPVASATAAQVKVERTTEDVLNEMRKARGQVI